MFSKLLNLIFGDKETKIRKKIDAKYKAAIEFQRNGNIRKYSEIMSEIAKLEDSIAEFNEKSNV